MTVTPIIRTLVAGMGVAAAALALPTTGAEAQGQVETRATHGSWTVRCASGTNNCLMVQPGKDAQGSDVIEMQIRKLTGVTAEGQNVPAAIQVAAPLGVLLPAGVRIQVDGQPVRAAPYEVCAQNGCVVRQPLSTDFLDELKRGNTAKVTVIAANQQEVAVNISLSGFTRAFNSLE